ncbi:MAG TPA: DJ-1/PfpI family protein [Myxococcaceae bacterium]|nr:DJ-1/PfpI family protein [Myxococcaceae bacterium]
MKRCISSFSLLPVALGVAFAASRADAAPAKEQTRTRNVAIVLYPGVELLDFAGPSEVFAAAANIGAFRDKSAFRVYTVAATRAPLVSQGFLKVTPDYSVEDAPPPDILVLPGGSSGSATGDARFMAWARKAIDGSEVSMSVCTGAFILGKAGVLDGRTATTWYGAVEHLRKAFPAASVQDGRRFIDQGRIVTTAGVSAGIDGALHVVARLLGRDVADRTARYMEYHWTPEPYLAEQYSLLNPGLDDRGRALQRAEMLEQERRWVEAARAYQALLDDAGNDGYVWNRLAVVRFSAGDAGGAIAAAKRAVTFTEVRTEALVNLAGMYAHAGKSDEALGALEEAVAQGFKQRWRIETDDFASLRTEPRYQTLISRL